MTHRAVQFQFAYAPYETLDVAGFPIAQAEDLVDRGIAIFYPPVNLAVPVSAAPAAPIIDALTEMDRAGLIAFGKEYLGMADEPPAEVTDDDLRTAIRASADPAVLAFAPQATSKPAKGAKKG